MVGYDWPGNVRELENAVERAFVLSGDEIDVDSLPQKLRNSAAGSFESHDHINFRPTLEETERRYVVEVMQAVQNDKTAAAKILGIDLSTLYRKLKRYDEL
jgi:transcriptional regulator with PAS, ATPase and Fis domain